MQCIDTVVIGAGQAGLAMSHHLTSLDRDHVVIDRGRIGERWRSERWRSLCLLTPNWMTRLPGYRYTGPDPDGFMSRTQVVEFFSDYAASFDAPVVEGTTVQSVEPRDDGRYAILTDNGSWLAANVVIATGAADVPYVPAVGAQLAPSVQQVAPTRYVDPSSLAPGGVLVVGASATGVQLAEELRRDGRDVVIAAGTHNRAPRTYRGMDIMWWLDQTGANERTVDQVADPQAARREPSTQLIGGSRDLDLEVLHRLGVRLAGRLVAADGSRLTFAGDLAQTVTDADRRLDRLLDRIDRHVRRTGLAAEVLPATRPRPVPVVGELRDLDLRRAGITSVVWATGYRRSYPWLRVPVLDDDGEIRHRRGLTPAPGVYVLGLRFQYRRRSNFIDGVGEDAQFIAGHMQVRAAAGARR